jgi:segregation and condensation protein B
METQLKSIIEALLFASEKPISVRDIREVLPDASPSEIQEALEAVKADFGGPERGFGVKEVGEGYQFRTNAPFAPYVLRMLKASPTRLSRAAMETLAIIAYKQPILRHEIERLRGVDSGGILKTLMEKDLIRIVGRKNIPGRPLVYGTTKKFLEVFDLKELDALPKMKEIQGLGSDEDVTETKPEIGSPGDALGPEPRPEIQEEAGEHEPETVEPGTET